MQSGYSTFQLKLKEKNIICKLRAYLGKFATFWVFNFGSDIHYLM